MKIITIIFFLLFPTAVLSAAPDDARYGEDKIFTGKPAAPDLRSHKDARRYRTELKRQSEKGPDFAGHFTLVTIGCGAGCIRVAVVDAGTGHVYFPKKLQYVFWAGWWHKPYEPQYKRQSRLLIVYGQANSEDAPYGISYYEWKGGDFELIRFEPHDPGRPPE